jgi:hypothetical protein
LAKANPFTIEIIRGFVDWSYGRDFSLNTELLENNDSTSSSTPR